jgi:agmatinase
VETGRDYLVPEMTQGLIADLGDADIHPTHPERSFASLTALTKAALERGALPVVIGGDHSISFAVVRAFDEPLFVLQFDAHTDYAPITEELRYTNGHAFRHITAMEHVKGLTQIGIRSLRSSREQIADLERDGCGVITMGAFRRMTPEEAVASLPENARCYVSIDIDALDISLVPGCVSGEPNGMSYAELRDTLAAAAKRLDIVGFDLVEVNPTLDVVTGATAYLGAHIIIEFLGQICDQPRWAARREKHGR